MGVQLRKRDCIQYDAWTYECDGDGGFWYSDTGVMVKWIILAVLFLVFTLWFVGGYMHAKRRLNKGLPVLRYHRFLVPYNLRYKYTQPPQNHFTFYQQQQQQSQPYGYPQAYPYQQRHDEPPPLYAHDAPPGYFAPQGASKMNPDQRAGGAVEMGQFSGEMAAGAQGAQQSGVVGSSAGNADLEAQGQALPPRPQPAKVAVRGFMDRFRR
ncbi:hypothetical protein P153DRAFT_284257 [Dothidotthia symphoricarpi CBS 119687]|uniref:Uncharacterized protein n=1 Tax=Dothidotthia symphoricarpi CBS 119687 TaxID=1392245 RepID=A0A6A6ALV1_9PLEO|nr:uncharacterized protein P153DRAFT_284257 [Dothidotthia symphoricarpi CBS 119687]KAF2132536.1 hypothetical protein P153DRAFT_284257 [Dothidotthia symphoricarpi CBS 119687]